MTVFREGGKDSPVSLRRVLAAYFALLMPALSILAIVKAPDKWYAYIPAGLCIASVLLLMFFTTWADISAIVQTIKQKDT